MLSLLNLTLLLTTGVPAADPPTPPPPPPERVSLPVGPLPGGAPQGNKGLGANPPRRLPATPAVEGQAPSWSDIELKEIFAAVSSAMGMNAQVRDAQSLSIAGTAYRVPAQAGENPSQYAKRILKFRRPDHPNVQNNQWLMAVYAQFFADLAARADVYGRLSTNRGDSQFFTQKARESKQYADQLSRQLLVVVEGVEGFVGALPRVEGERPEHRGAQVTVRNGKIAVENLDRVTWPGDMPPPDVTRTAHGAIKELYSALRQYDIGQRMIGHYEDQARMNSGHVRLFAPGVSPSVYLNEIARAAQEAEISALHLMTMNKQGELGQLLIPLNKPKPSKNPTASKKSSAAKKPKPGKAGTGAAPAAVSCADTLPLQKCAERIAEARAAGPIVFVESGVQ